MLDYRITTFLTLYDEMNYRRTAEKLNMTQPGVTQHIHVLERYYGVKLFLYDGRTLRRTRQAELLKRHVDSMRTEELALREEFVKKEGVQLKIGATKTIGEFVMIPQVRQFLSVPKNNLELMIDNTETLLRMLRRAELDFAVIEGVFDKTRYGYCLFKKENFVGICAKAHPFAHRQVTFAEVLKETLVVREKGSGTRMLLQQAVVEKGFSLGSFARCSSVSNFSVICELVARDNAITFAYEPIARCRDDLATFCVEDMQIVGEFNFVYCNERVAREKIALFLNESA